LRVLLIMEQCNPLWASVPLVGYRFFQHLDRLVDATLVTHVRNRQGLEKENHRGRIVYVEESPITARYYRLAAKVSSRGGVNWPLQHALTYPVYAEFNRKVYERFKGEVAGGRYDLVHALTPILPRYPVKIVRACGRTPFVLGPVNGGVPFPAGFREVARKEFDTFNFLRIFSRLLPGYRETYVLADRVLAGSTYTLNMLDKMFPVRQGKLGLFYENGIPPRFLEGPPPQGSSSPEVNLLFAGRLVPYKGADMLVEAVGRLPERVRLRTRLRIVGDGPERGRLEAMTRQWGMNDRVVFTGWVKQEETLRYYRDSHLFCFPSVREFGGAVVLEAMACGLPCIVADHGGIGEYVTRETGVKIVPRSREHVVEELEKALRELVENEEARREMSVRAAERARRFEWGRKAEEMVRIYEEAVEDRAKR